MKRFLKKIYARAMGYFWLPCPVCGEHFGGFEIGNGRVTMPNGTRQCTCKNCDFDAGIIEGMREPKFISKNAADFLGI